MEEVARQRAERKAVTDRRTRRRCRRWNRLAARPSRDAARQFDATTHQGRRAGLKQALAEIDPQVTVIEAAFNR